MLTTGQLRVIESVWIPNETRSRSFGVGFIFRGNAQRKKLTSRNNECTWNIGQDLFVGKISKEKKKKQNKRSACPDKPPGIELNWRAPLTRVYVPTRFTRIRNAFVKLADLSLGTLRRRPLKQRCVPCVFWHETVCDGPV